MNRAQFMQKLGALLGDLPVNERTDALKYYADYFDDAGEENVDKVLEELGTPEQVAKIIKAELNAKDRESGEFTEAGYKNPVYDRQTGMPVEVISKGTSQQSERQNNTSGQTTQTTTRTNTPPAMEGWKIVLIVLLCIFAIPVGIPLISAVFSIMIGVLSAVVGLVIGFGAAAVGLFVGAIVLLAVGLFNLATLPFVSLVLIGVGLLLAALGMLFLILTVLICGKLIPAVCRGIVAICRMPFKKKEVIA